jgi:hypothetical protein
MINRKYFTLVTFIGLILLFSGCSSKKYFEPENTFSASHVSKSYGANIVDLSRDGGTLSNGQYLGKAGVNAINLGEGYRFLNESNTYVLAKNAEGILKIIDKKSTETLRAVSLHIPVVSATIRNGVIAYILNNNTFGIYLVKENRKIVENRSERTFAIDTRAASPMFIDSLAVMPMLDGKLIIVNQRNTDDAKVVYLSSDKVFNNIVYLSRTSSTMVAATPKKLITLGNGGKKEYHANISEVTIANGNIYLFTKEGTVIKLDKALNPLAKKKFKYAHFSASTAFGGRVFALDQEGALIVLSADLSKHKIYDLGDVDSPVFITGSRLYKDGKIIELSKLGYE